MTAKTVLTKQQLERMAIYMQLNQNYDSVMIIEKHGGIGPVMWARFFKSQYPDRYQEIEITDVENW